MYKISFGYEGNRGIEYVSKVNPKIIEALWEHTGYRCITRTASMLSPVPETTQYYLSDGYNYSNEGMIDVKIEEVSL